MKFNNPFKKSQQNFDIKDPLAWDKGLYDVGPLLPLLDYYNNIMRGKGGVQTFTEAASQIAQLKSWVYTVVTVIGWEVANTEWWIEKKRGEKWERVKNDRRADDFMRILEEPWPYADETSLKLKIMQHMDTCGKCNLDIITNGPGGNVLLGLAPYDPSRMDFSLGQNGLIDSWRYGGATIPKDRVIYVWYPRPDSLYKPMSPIEALSAGVDLNYSMIDFVSKTVKNDGRRSGYVTPDESVNMPADKIQKLFEWAKGESGKVGGIGVIPAKVKMLSQSHSPKDMDFIEGRDRMIEEICAGYGYPAALLHGKELNRSVMEVLTMLKDKRCIEPRLSLIETALSKQLVKRFLGPDYQITFNRKPFQFSDDVFRMLDIDMKYGITTANEVRADRGLQPATWAGADEPYKVAAPPQPFALPQPNDNPVPEPPKSATALIIKDNKAIDRVAVWKSFDSLARANERPMRTAVKRYFAKQRELVIGKAQALADAGKIITVDAILDHAQAQESVKAVLTSHIQYAADSGYERGCIQCDAAHSGKSDAKIREHVKAKALNSARLITDTTRDKIAALIPSAGGKAATVMTSMEAFIKELNDLYDSFEAGRTDNITETEVVSAINWGSQTGYQDSGAAGKEWLSQQDGRVRGSQPGDQFDHRLDGVAVPMDGKFNTGPESIDYPGDPFASAGNICNCRCTILPTFNNE
jgi:HK97 family phage portal protein